MADNLYDIGLVSNDPVVIRRVESICSEFKYQLKLFSTLDSLVETGAEDQYRMILTCDIKMPESKEGEAPARAPGPAEFAQAARFVCRDGFVVCTVGSRMGKDAASFAKKSGADLILLEEEILGTSKLEYILTQVVRAGHLPVKAVDLLPDKEIPFDLYHVLPLRRKFVKFAFAGDVLSKEKVEKLKEAGELYIQRSHIDAFNQYMTRNTSASAAGLGGRCRAKFLNLYVNYSKLLFLLTDQSAHGSYAEGAELLKHCRQVSAELLAALAEFERPWEIVNVSAIGDFGSVERSPAIAAYAGLFALRCELSQIEDIMLAALLSNIGLLLLPPSISSKIRSQTTDTFTPEEEKLFRSYPHQSVSVILGRKLPVEEKLRELILCTHERADGKGFPRGLSGKKVPEQSQVVLFAGWFDQSTLVKLGKARANPAETVVRLVKEELAQMSRFTPEFVLRLKNAFLTE